MPPQLQGDGTIRLVIEARPGMMGGLLGEVSVNGPINDLALCYALIESAKDIIRNHVAKGQQSKIIPANGLVLTNPNGL